MSFETHCKKVNLHINIPTVAGKNFLLTLLYRGRGGGFFARGQKEIE